MAAEKAGANVTGLLNQLNIADSLLAKAENAYRTGDNNTAINDVNAVLPITQQVTAAAQTAKTTATTSAQTAFWLMITITIIAGVVFVLALFLIWRRFKRGYINRLSKAKPEVNSNEA